jgi:hypothetical protein
VKALPLIPILILTIHRRVTIFWSRRNSYFCLHPEEIYSYRLRQKAAMQQFEIETPYQRQFDRKNGFLSHTISQQQDISEHHLHQHRDKRAACRKDNLAMIFVASAVLLVVIISVSVIETKRNDRHFASEVPQPAPPQPAPPSPAPTGEVLSFSWTTLPVFFHSMNQSGPFSPAALQIIAKFPIATFEKAMAWENGQHMVSTRHTHTQTHP